MPENNEATNLMNFQGLILIIVHICWERSIMDYIENKMNINTLKNEVKKWLQLSSIKRLLCAQTHLYNRKYCLK